VIRQVTSALQGNFPFIGSGLDKEGTAISPPPKDHSTPWSDICVALSALEFCDFITEETFGATDETRR